MQIFACQFKGRTETVQAESCERKSPIYEVLLQHQKPPSSTFVLRAAAFIPPAPAASPCDPSSPPSPFPAGFPASSPLTPGGRRRGPGGGDGERSLMSDKAHDKSRSDSKANRSAACSLPSSVPRWPSGPSRAGRAPSPRGGCTGLAAPLGPGLGCTPAWGWGSPPSPALPAAESRRRFQL